MRGSGNTGPGRKLHGTEWTGARVLTLLSVLGNETGKRLTGAQLNGRESLMTDPDVMVAPTTMLFPFAVSDIVRRMSEMSPREEVPVCAAETGRRLRVCLRSSEETKQKKGISVIYQIHIVNCEPCHVRFLVGNNIKELHHIVVVIGPWVKAAMPFEEAVMAGNNNRTHQTVQSPCIS